MGAMTGAPTITVIKDHSFADGKSTNIIKVQTLSKTKEGLGGYYFFAFNMWTGSCLFQNGEPSINIDQDDQGCATAYITNSTGTDYTQDIEISIDGFYFSNNKTVHFTSCLPDINITRNNALADGKSTNTVCANFSPDAGISNTDPFDKICFRIVQNNDLSKETFFLDGKNVITISRDPSNGEAIADLYAYPSKTGGSVSVEAQAPGTSAWSKPVTLTFLSDVTYNIELRSDKPWSYSDGQSPIQVIATVTDHNGDPAAGLRLLFSLPKDETDASFVSDKARETSMETAADGTARVQVVCNSVATNKTITVSVTSEITAPQNQNIQFIAPTLDHWMGAEITSVTTINDQPGGVLFTNGLQVVCFNIQMKLLDENGDILRPSGVDNKIKENIFPQFYKAPYTKFLKKDNAPHIDDIFPASTEWAYTWDNSSLFVSFLSYQPSDQGQKASLNTLDTSKDVWTGQVYVFCNQVGSLAGVEIPIGFKITPTGTNAKPIIYSTENNATQYGKTPTPCVKACSPVKYSTAQDGNTNIPKDPEETVTNHTPSGLYNISYDKRYIELVAAQYNVNTPRYYIPEVYAYLEGSEISGNIKDSIVWCDTAFEYVPPNGHEWLQNVFNHEFSKSFSNPNTLFYNIGLYFIKPPYIEKSESTDTDKNTGKKVTTFTYNRVIPYPDGFSYKCYQWGQWEYGKLHYFNEPQTIEVAYQKSRVYFGKMISCYAQASPPNAKSTKYQPHPAVLRLFDQCGNTGTFQITSDANSPGFSWSGTHSSETTLKTTVTDFG